MGRGTFVSEGPPEPLPTVADKHGGKHVPERVDLLVYGECRCGWWCACPEGWSWPKCPKCDLRVFPRRQTDLGKPDSMVKNLAHGYVAELYDEATAARLAAERGYNFGETCGITELRYHGDDVLGERHHEDFEQIDHPGRLYDPDDPLLNPKR